MGCPPDPHSKPSDPILPIWAGFLFVFLKFLTSNGWGHYLTSSLLPLAKEHNKLLQEPWQAAQLTRHIKAGKYFLALWCLLKDLRPQMAKVLIWKSRKPLSEDKIPQRKWGKEEESYIGALRQKKGTAIEVRAAWESRQPGTEWEARGQLSSPTPHGPGPRGPPRMDRDHQHTQPSRCHFLLGQERTRWQKQQVTAQASLGTWTHPCSVTGLVNSF